MKKISVNEALTIAHGCSDFYKAFARLEEMLATVADLDKERAKAQADCDMAIEDKEEAERQLTVIQGKIAGKQAELDQAVETASTRVEEEKLRVQEPLRKVKDELREVRYKAEMEKKKLTAEINDRQSTKAQLDGQIKQMENNLRDRTREREDWDRQRAQFSEEQEDHQREIRNLQAQRAQLLDAIERLERQRQDRMKEEAKQERRASP